MLDGAAALVNHLLHRIFELAPALGNGVIDKESNARGDHSDDEQHHKNGDANNTLTRGLSVSLVDIFGSLFSSLCLAINILRGLVTLRRNTGRLAIVLIGLLDLLIRLNRRRVRLRTMRSFDMIIFIS